MPPPQLVWEFLYIYIVLSIYILELLCMYILGIYNILAIAYIHTHTSTLLEKLKVTRQTSMSSRLLSSLKKSAQKKCLNFNKVGFLCGIYVLHSLYGWMYRPPNIHPLTLGKRLLDLFFCVSGWCRECRADSFSLQILEIYVARGCRLSSLHTLLLPRLSTIFSIAARFFLSFS